MKNFNSQIALLFLVGMSISHLAQATQCEVVRAAYDVGTSGIKLSASVVDVCKSSLIKKIYGGGKIAVGFGAQLKGATLASPQAFPETWLATDGLKAFVDAKAKVTEEVAKITNELTGQPYSIDEHIGIATHAFRVSTNGEAFLKNEVKNLGIDIRMISQAREGELEFAGVTRSLNSSTDPRTIASWGIGDGSLQFITTQNALKNQSLSFVSSIAAGTFKTLLVEKLGKEGKSPNPISTKPDMMTTKSDFSIASDLIDSETDKAMRAGNSESFLNYMLSNHPRVYGVGGIHTGAIKNAISNAGLLKSDEFGSYYTSEDLASVTSSLLDLSDAQIVEKMNPKDFKDLADEKKEALRNDPKLQTFAQTQVSSMILVLRTMQKFKVERVYLSNADGTGEIYFMKEFSPQPESSKPANKSLETGKVMSNPSIKAAVRAKVIVPKLNAREAVCQNFVKDHAAAFKISKHTSERTHLGKKPMGAFGCLVNEAIPSCDLLGAGYGISRDQASCYLMVPVKGGADLMVYVPLM